MSATFQVDFKSLSSLFGKIKFNVFRKMENAQGVGGP
jgi:hypothetical protein